jgi:hypothetical protein
MLVAMVTAPGTPASATICASFSCWRAFSTLCGTPSFFRRPDRNSDFSIEVVPTSTGWPRSCALDLADDGLVLLARGAVDLIVLVHARDGPVRRDLDHAEPVDVHELLGLGRRRAGHAGQLVVEPEVVLERHRGERHVLGLDLRAPSLASIAWCSPSDSAARSSSGR